MLVKNAALRPWLMGLLLLLGSLLTAGPGWAQSPPSASGVWGQVVTVGGQPLAGVSVWVPGTTRSTSTNAEGEFLLADLPPRVDRLRFELPTFLAVEVALRDTTRRPLRVQLHSTRPTPRRRAADPERKATP